LRQVLADGELSLAERLLGRPVSISGSCTAWSELGRQFGCATATVQLKRVRAPLQGVYAVSVPELEWRDAKGVAIIARAYR